MDLLDPPTHCSIDWHQLERGDSTYAGSELYEGLASLTLSPLRRFQLEGFSAVELSEPRTERFLGQLYTQLHIALPLSGARIQRTQDGEVLVLAVIDGTLTAEDAVRRLDSVFPWFVEHAPTDGFLLDFRRS